MPQPYALRALSNYERTGHDFTHQAVLTANELTQVTVATAQSFALGRMAVGSFIEKVMLRLITPFEDLSDAAFNTDPVDIGDTGSATRFLSAQEVNKNGTEITAPVWTNTAFGPYAASQDLLLRVNSMVAKALVNIDKGELHVLVKITDTKPLSDGTPPTGITK